MQLFVQGVKPLDVGNLRNSVLFDTKTGFGTNGVGNDCCLADGPLANLTLRFDEKLKPISYCLIRNINGCFFKAVAQKTVDTCLAKKTFLEAWNCLETQPHGAGHGGIGGIVSLSWPKF